MIDAGCWKLETGNWKLETGNYTVINTYCLMLLNRCCSGPKRS